MGHGWGKPSIKREGIGRLWEGEGPVVMANARPYQPFFLLPFRHAPIGAGTGQEDPIEHRKAYLQMGKEFQCPFPSDAARSNTHHWIQLTSFGVVAPAVGGKG